jgi:hypothetical protein
VHLTERARRELRPGEALVFDWHRVAMCCAAGGEVSLRRTTTDEVERRRQFVPLGEGDAPVYGHRRMVAYLDDRRLEVDCRRTLGIRRFTSSLPGDFGLRAVFGRLPAESDRKGVS